MRRLVIIPTYNEKENVAAGAQMFGMDSSFERCNLMGDIPNCTTWGYWPHKASVVGQAHSLIRV